jgi:hypothetical protein
MHLTAYRDRELQVAYCRLSEAKHGWNYTRQQLDLTYVEVDTRTHMIVHLEHALETYDLDLKERAVTIATLKQQLQVLHRQMPPTPKDLAEPDAVSDVGEVRSQDVLGCRVGWPFVILSG